MDGLYAEARAKKRETAKDKILKFATYGGMIFFFILGLFSFKMIFTF